MKLDKLKFVLILMVFVSIISVIFFVSAESIDTSKIGVVEDYFNSITYSLNEYTISGLKKAQEDLGIGINTVKAIDENNDDIALEKLVNDGKDIVIASGFMMQDAIEDIFEIYPEQKNVIMDSDFYEETPDSVVSILF